MGERPVTLHYDDRDVNICYVVKKTGMRASSAKKAKEPEAPCMTLTIFQESGSMNNALPHVQNMQGCIS